MDKLNKFLVVGLGSMGKRRIRNLLALGYDEIAGFDLRGDRVSEAVEKYGTLGFKSFDDALSSFKPCAVVISTSPKYHMDYAFTCEALGLPFFIEASVTDSDRILELHEKSLNGGVIIAPSCTMLFYPGPKMVKKLIRGGAIGKVLNVNYQIGQYLPDWHPWEDISEFYVSDPETGGAREIVPFELTWLSDIFGKANVLFCNKRKLSEMNVPIDDIYHCIMEYAENIICNLTVEVLSRPKATRELRIIGSEGMLVMSGEENCVKLCSTDSSEWSKFDLDHGTVEDKYIYPEEPYIEEMRSFINAANKADQSLFPNNLLKDYDILKVLLELERVSA